MPFPTQSRMLMRQNVNNSLNTVPFQLFIHFYLPLIKMKIQYTAAKNMSFYAC